MNNSSHTSYLLNSFQNQIQEEFDKIENQELKIILALSDLLEDPQEHEENFINKSLEHLKKHYGLTKSVWKVLLYLNTHVPNFTDKLSKWQDLKFINNGNKILSWNHESHYQWVAYQYKTYNTNREYHLANLFEFIHILCQHFTIEETSNYVGVFVSDFDTKKCSFSKHNLSVKSKNLIDNEEADRITNMDVQFFTYFLCQHNQMYYSLIELSDAYLKIKKLKDPVLDRLSFVFKDMKIQSSNTLETFQNIINTYKKYTSENFITYKGLLEIKEKEISKQDWEIINILFTELNKSELLNTIKKQRTLVLLKLMRTHENNIIRGLEKRNDLFDFMSNSHNIKMLEDLLLNNQFNLKNLTTLQHQWEQNGGNRVVKQEFKNFGIDLQIDSYFFEQIKDSDRLYEEGKSQYHCVYTYFEKCLEGNTIIVSMKDHNNNKVSTIRLLKKQQKFSPFRKKTSWELVENRKRFNKSCSKEEKKAANLYFEHIKDKLV